MFAKVIIDIKHEAVNQSYDYIVPQDFEDFLVVGMRVLVPFATMERLGFVVEIMYESDTATKEIKEVLDSTPVIDDDLHHMITDISKGSYELMSALYQTVIPSELLVNYQKVANIIHKDAIPEDLINKFNKKARWILTKNDQVYYKRLKRLKDLGHIDLVTQIKQKATYKTKKGYLFNYLHTYPKINQYPMVLNLDKDYVYTTDELLEHGFSVSHIKTLVKHEVFTEQDVRIKRDIHHVYDPIDKAIELTKSQKHAVEDILNPSNKGVILLKGVTGSGKTEVYIEVIKHIQGAVLLLVPEIHLIAPLSQRLMKLFEDEVAWYHSGLSKGERHDQYQSIIAGEKRIIIGTRSAIFLSIPHLKMVILDEEHDESYCQKEGVYYDARELIIKKAQRHSIPLVLVSATPRIETMYKAQNHIYHLINLPERYLQKLPTIHYVDMKKELTSKNYTILSKQLKHMIEERLEKKEQTILFINRKGYAAFVMCRSCGDVPKCQHCDVSLTYYKDKKILKCPYCGFEKNYDTTCEVCKESKVKEVGAGIEYVEEQLKKLLPQARILRMDKHIMRTKGAHEIIWHDFLHEEADILLGTHVVTKGLDFPKVTLVGILMADMLLKIPSFQSSEKAYMLLAQASGRSGRHLQGDAVIQAYDIDHKTIRALSYDYDRFYHEALFERKMLGYPPFHNICQVLFTGLNFLKTYQIAFLMKKRLALMGYDVLGPSQAIIKKIKDHYRFTLTIKYDTDLQGIFDVIEILNSEEVSINFLPNPDA